MKQLIYFLVLISIGLLAYIFFFACKSNFKPLQFGSGGPTIYLEKDIELTDEVKLNKLIELTNEMERLVNNKALLLASGVRTIDVDSAKYFRKFYFDRREFIEGLSWPVDKAKWITGDTNDAVIFPLKKLLLAMHSQFGEDMNDFSKWDDLGFVAYLANYGEWGHKVSNRDEDKYISTVLIQLAKRDPTNSNKWNPIAREIYNFGDLKPPKIVLNPLVDY